MRQSYSTRFTEPRPRPAKPSLRPLYTAIAWALCYPMTAMFIALLISSGAGDMA